ncbi:MAG: hypothetical protein A2V66_01085 [Ignavibacteria bacterium RBG_13_36_8]|nr:MAG: hypothetical protein A2V66_01085 [Ignavibacteria bacterium RBG_13_36_8]
MNKKYVVVFAVIVVLLCISCEKEVFTGPPEEGSAQNGMIYIDSKPSGSRIFLNNRNYGTVTPDTLKWLSDTDYLITLKTLLFQDTSFYVHPTNGVVLDLYVDYLANPSNYASIRCFSEPENAQIVLNDSILHRLTPDTLTGLYPGTYKVKYTLPEHRADSVYVFVRGGEYTDAVVALEDTSRYVSYTKTNSGMSSNILSSIVIDVNGVKWIGTRDKGLVKLEGDVWTLLNQSNAGLLFNCINCLTLDNRNNLWIGTPLGLMKYDGRNFINFSFLLPDFYVSAIAFDASGNGWFGTQNGLVKYIGNTYTVYKTINSGLSDNFVTVILPEGNNIWIGTNAFGINLFDGTNWTVYIKTNSLMQGDGVLSGFIDHNGTKWFDILPMPALDENGGLVTFNGITWQNRSIGSAMELRKIYTIVEDEIYNMWFGTKSGIAKMDTQGNVTLYNATNSGIPSLQVNKIAMDSNNNLWIATNGGGLIKYKKNIQ